MSLNQMEDVLYFPPNP